MNKKNIVLYIILIACAIGAYAVYGMFNHESEAGINEAKIEQAFAVELSDVIQEEWMSDEVNYDVTTSVAYEYKRMLKERGFDSIWEQKQFIEDKNSEYQNKAEEDIDFLGEYIEEDNQDLLKKYAEKIGSAQTCTQIQECEEKYKEIIQEAEQVKKEEEERIAAEKAAAEKRRQQMQGDGSVSFNHFMSAGVINWGGYKYTYYSQSVLPGGGLRIPGRHVEGGFVKDGDGYICVANSRPNGTILSSPWGACKIYDKGTSGNHIDVYVR